MEKIHTPKFILLKCSSPPVQWGLRGKRTYFFGQAFESEVQGRGSLGKADTVGCLCMFLAPAPGMGHEPIPLDSNWFRWWHGCNSSQWGVRKSAGGFWESFPLKKKMKKKTENTHRKSWSLFLSGHCHAWLWYLQVQLPSCNQERTEPEDKDRMAEVKDKKTLHSWCEHCAAE